MADYGFVEYAWEVRTTKAWMNPPAFVARPIFVWDHHVALRQGGEGLARLLGVDLISGQQR